MHTNVCKPNSILSKDMLCGPFYLLITQKCLYAFLVCQDKIKSLKPRFPAPYVVAMS